MPCGYDAEIAHREAEMHRDQLRRVGAGEVVAVDAAAYFSRPGPRIVDGLELLAGILHPELFPEPPRRPGALTRRAREPVRPGSAPASEREAVRRQAVPPATAIAATTLITATATQPRERERLLARRSPNSTTSQPRDAARHEPADMPADRDVAGRSA